MITVGTVVKLKRPCLGNPIGTLGVGFNDYGSGCQVIFENGEFDGFSNSPINHHLNEDAETEQDVFLEDIGFSELLSGYVFQNAMKVNWDYNSGVFDSVLKSK